jgi:hypothetical protein
MDLVMLDSAGKSGSSFAFEKSKVA